MESKSAKNANLLFLTVVGISLLANIFVSLASIKGVEINIIANLLVSQVIILIPGLIFFITWNKDSTYEKMYKRVRTTTILLLLVFTWLLMPLVTAANAFSQLFTTNEVLNISGEVLDLPLWLMVVIIGIIGPFSEEFVFRGLIYRNLRGRGERYIAASFVSAMFFGLMHMNLNQFCYAFILGVVFSLINEILDSTWPSFICHALINTQNVFMLYIYDKILSATSAGGIAEYYNNSIGVEGDSSPQMKLVLIIMFVVLLFVALITTSLAILLLYGISALEGKEDRFKMVFRRNSNAEKVKILYFTGYLAISLCVFVIFLLEPLLKLLK